MKLAWPLAAALVLLVAAPALATGTVRIQQSDNSVQSYTGVEMRIAGKKLMLTSADKVSTVVIGDAACANVGELIRCNGGTLSLRQDGTHAIPFRSATFYFNLTDDYQPLPLSTLKVGPHSVIFAAHTAKGTYITGNGTLDEGGSK